MKDTSPLREVALRNLHRVGVIHSGFLSLFLRAFVVRAFAAAFNAFACWSSYLR